MLVKLIFRNRIIDILYNLDKYMQSQNQFEAVCFHLVSESCVGCMERNALLLEICAYPTVALVQFTDQSRISENRAFYLLRIPEEDWEKLQMERRFAFQANAKIALLCASMTVTYYIKLFRTGTNRHNGILMSLLLIKSVTEYLRLTLALPWNSALREKFNFYFSRVFC